MLADMEPRKDNICTPSIGLPTTCGSFALVGAKARDDAVLVKRLIAAGALVIGKANLTVRFTNDKFSTPVPALTRRNKGMGIFQRKLHDIWLERCRWSGK